MTTPRCAASATRRLIDPRAVRNKVPAATCRGLVEVTGLPSRAIGESIHFAAGYAQMASVQFGRTDNLRAPLIHLHGQTGRWCACPERATELASCSAVDWAVTTLTM